MAVNSQYQTARAHPGPAGGRPAPASHASHIDHPPNPRPETPRKSAVLGIKWGGGGGGIKWGGGVGFRDHRGIGTRVSGPASVVSRCVGGSAIPYGTPQRRRRPTWAGDFYCRDHRK